jgi:hypothetical protein
LKLQKKWYCSVKGELNKSIAFYKRSGNGTGNLREQSVNSTSTSSGPSTNENIVDDNRSSFISNLHVGYFWALSEVCGLTNNISQNCSKIGISSTSTMSSSTASSSMRRGKKSRVEETGQALLSCVTEMKDSLVTQEINRNILQLENAVQVARSLLIEM